MNSPANIFVEKFLTVCIFAKPTDKSTDIRFWGKEIFEISGIKEISGAPVQREYLIRHQKLEKTGHVGGIL
jgi:hypothetical protein